MNLFAGLEKFGLKAEGTTNLFEEEKKVTTTADGTQKEEIPDEDSFLLDKAIRCAVCDKVFKTKIIKNGRVKRMEPDLDLRPRFEYIDTLKYNVVSCPYCGYTHDCYHDVRNPVTEEWEGVDYAPEKEFNYCPMCGECMKG